MKIRTLQHSFALLFSLSAIVLPVSHVHGHGGVYLEDDLCVIKVGFYQAHFTIFQPTISGHEQFCEDVPIAGESIFVLEYLHDGLEELPVDFRIIENTTNMGLFATWEDVQALTDIDDVTVFYHPPVREPDVFAVLHEFASPGQFIGIVTSLHPDTDKLYTAVFPFEVGYAGINYLAIGMGIVLVALVLWVSTLLRGLWRNRAVAAAAAILALSLPLQSVAAEPEYVVEGTYFRVTATPALTPLEINRMHRWRIALTDRDGNPVQDAVIDIEGGMPQHDHGLPTSPATIEQTANGIYVVDGMKFHMRGAWEIEFAIESGDVAETLTLSFKI